jgi:hypothetical protein
MLHNGVNRAGHAVCARGLGSSKDKSAAMWHVCVWSQKQCQAARWKMILAMRWIANMFMACDMENSELVTRCNDVTSNCRVAFWSPTTSASENRVSNCVLECDDPQEPLENLENRDDMGWSRVKAGFTPMASNVSETWENREPINSGLTLPAPFWK